MTTIAITNQTSPEADTIAADKLIAGNAATKLWHQFTDTTGQFHVGQWASEACKLSVSYDENELCVIVEGVVELTDADAGQPAGKKGGGWSCSFPYFPRTAPKMGRFLLPGLL